MLADEAIPSDFVHLVFPVRDYVSKSIAQSMEQGIDNWKSVRHSSPYVLFEGWKSTCTTFFGQQSAFEYAHSKGQISKDLIEHLERRVLAEDPVDLDRVILFRMAFNEALLSYSDFCLNLFREKSYKSRTLVDYLSPNLKTQRDAILSMFCVQPDGFFHPIWDISYSTRYFMWFDALVIADTFSKLKNSQRLMNTIYFTTVNDILIQDLPFILLNGRPPLTEEEMKRREDVLKWTIPDELLPNLNFKGDKRPKKAAQSPRTFRGFRDRLK